MRTQAKMSFASLPFWYAVPVPCPVSVFQQRQRRRFRSSRSIVLKFWVKLEISLRFAELLPLNHTSLLLFFPRYWLQVRQNQRFQSFRPLLSSRQQGGSGLFNMNRISSLFHHRKVSKYNTFAILLLTGVEAQKSRKLATPHSHAATRTARLGRWQCKQCQ